MSVAALAPRETSGAHLNAEFPEKLAFLFEPHRYKIAYGGRGGAKSWSFSRALLIQGLERPLRILCAREIQKSIAESVHQILADSIVALGMQDNYEVLNTEIRGRNGSKGTDFLFAGLRHNVDNIKSKEGLDRVWVEEADNVSKKSWDKLIPTIRKDGSEIWISYNPNLDTDETHKRFVLNPPARAKVVKIDMDDNPWKPKELVSESEELKKSDPDAWLHVYGGHCKIVLDGAILAKEIRAALAEGRIGQVPVDRTKQIDCYWDLGRRDFTSIWFIQTVGFQHRVVDFFQDRGHALPHYISELQRRAFDPAKMYNYGIMYMPHDADSEVLGAEHSIKRQMQNANFKVVVTPRVQEKALGINAIRNVFPKLWFDESNTSDGVQALKRWRFDVDDSGQYSLNPLHDENSHAADALQTFALAIRENPKKPKLKMTPQINHGGAQGWMR